MLMLILNQQSSHHLSAVEAAAKLWLCFLGQLIQSTKSLTMNDLFWWAICSVKQGWYIISHLILGHFMWYVWSWSTTNTVSRSATWRSKYTMRPRYCLWELCFPITQSDERRWMSFCSGGYENLFRVIESAEQKRQTSALKSFSAWAERGIFTISSVNTVPSASKHKCYQ